MLDAPKCYLRGCRHLLGVTQPNGTEASEVPYCFAYPDGIPKRIAYGDDLHLTVQPDQVGKIIFEKEK